MTRSQFNKLVDAHWAEIQKLCDTKGTDYSNETDRLSNFKDNALRTGLTPLQVWAVYCFKHINALESYVRNGQVESEPIEERVHDIILYLFLFLGLIEDTNIDQTTPFNVVR